MRSLLRPSRKSLTSFTASWYCVGRREAVHAGAEAAVDVVLQTRPRAPSVDRDRAVANQEVALDQPQRFAGKAAGEKRSGVVGPVLPHAPGNHRAGVGLVDREPDVGIGLVVAKQDVVARLVSLDQIVLERQRFAFGIGDDELHVMDRCPHLVQPRIEIAGILEVTPHAVAKRTRLADIDRRSGDILVEVDAGAGGFFPV